MASFNLKALEKSIDSIDERNIFKHIFYCAIEAPWIFLSYTDAELDALENPPEIVQARNLLKRRFMDFYSTEGWDAFWLILRQNLENSEDGHYLWEDKYAEQYNSEYIKNVAAVIQCYAK